MGIAGTVVGLNRTGLRWTGATYTIYVPIFDTNAVSLIAGGIEVIFTQG